MLARQPWSTLRAFLDIPGLDATATIEKLKKYAHSLLEWNRGVSNLISRHDESRLVERHIAESLKGVPILHAAGCRRFVDLGSGAGLPAIPLALAGIGEHWTLVESRRNKTLFMRKFLSDMGMNHIAVECSRLETLLETDPVSLRCDGFTSRATMAAGPTLEMAAGVVRPGGFAFLWKGSGLEGEMKATEKSWEKQWRFITAHPLSEGQNSIAVFERTTED